MMDDDLFRYKEKQRVSRLEAQEMPQSGFRKGKTTRNRSGRWKIREYRFLGSNPWPSFSIRYEFAYSEDWIRCLQDIGWRRDH